MDIVLKWIHTFKFERLINSKTKSFENGFKIFYNKKCFCCGSAISKTDKSRLKNSFKDKD